MKEKVLISGFGRAFVPCASVGVKNGGSGGRKRVREGEREGKDDCQLLFFVFFYRNGGGVVVLGCIISFIFRMLDAEKDARVRSMENGIYFEW